MTDVQGLVGIDLDNCISEDGTIEPWAQELVARANSYAELSPSGRGIRIFVFGSVDRDQAKPIEIYGGHSPRYLTITGHRLAQAPEEINLAPPEFLPWLGRTYPPPVKESAPVDINMPEFLLPSELPAIADLPLRQGAKEFLTNGVIPSHGDGSHALAAATAALYEATAKANGELCDDLVLSLLVSNEHAMNVAMRHREQDQVRAVEYLWQHHCLKMRDKVKPPTHDFNAIDQMRQIAQQAENKRIGEEGVGRYPAAEQVTLDEALTRHVFVSDGSRVADLLNPRHDLSLHDWKNTYAASKITLNKSNKKKPAPVTELWLDDPRRKTVLCRTFKAGAGPIVNDPNGRQALNIWQPFDRPIVLSPTAASVDVFVTHVRFLFGDEAERFLDWLAHIEQQPGVLPHTAWVHIASHYGLGRNWLASVLVRLWAGAVAANVDLTGILDTGFNGRLAHKILAVVDEIREGGSDTRWRHAETIKRLITEETRLINPKYGRQHVEFNSCRWLIFSNHVSALPLDQGDRRFEVVHTDAKPQPPEYYVRLYALLESPDFINAVGLYLRNRDISHFNPGAHAQLSDAKRAVIAANQTPAAAACELLVQYWPSDLIKSADLANVLNEGDSSKGHLTTAHRYPLEEAGIVALDRRIRVNNVPTRIYSVRQKERWRNATGDEMRAELSKASIGMDTAYTALLNNLP